MNLSAKPEMSESKQLAIAVVLGACGGSFFIVYMAVGYSIEALLPPIRFPVGVGVILLLAAALVHLCLFFILPIIAAKIGITRKTFAIVCGLMQGICSVLSCFIFNWLSFGSNAKPPDSDAFIVLLVIGLIFVPGNFFLVWLIARGSRGRRAAERATNPLCAQCGYDLRGNVSGRCPECGESCIDSLNG